MPTSRRRAGPDGSWKQRLRALFERYGVLAVVIFVALSAAVLGSAWTAVQLGWRADSVAGRAGTFGAAYVVYRLTLPLRIAATMALTPLAARLLDRLRRPQQPT